MKKVVGWGIIFGLGAAYVALVGQLVGFWAVAVVVVAAATLGGLLYIAAMFILGD